MNKDFIYVPSKNVYLNVCHIVEMSVINDDEFKVVMSNTTDNMDQDPRYWYFPIEDFKCFEIITGVLTPIKE